MTAKRRAAAGGDGMGHLDLACACASARQLARALTQLYDRRLRRAGLEAPQFAIMMTLTAGPCSQSTLGRRHVIDKTTISRNLKMLQRKGWVTVATTGDRRERRAALTAAGQERLTRARGEWQQAQAELQGAMPSAQWRAMFTTFRTALTATETLQREGSRDTTAG
ncbi:MAG TPA: MarR family winged helix-turn-helix transcriptional regulator [Vicinamibacterales bacterium]|nr:MarR family winged helix-turn-helix transcriptional regulator [Vicinamibacterales bacterium]